MNKNTQLDCGIGLTHSNPPPGELYAVLKLVEILLCKVCMSFFVFRTKTRCTYATYLSEKRA